MCRLDRADVSSSVQFMRTGRLVLYGGKLRRCMRWRTKLILLLAGALFAPVVTRWYAMLQGIQIKSKPACELE